MSRERIRFGWVLGALIVLVVPGAAAAQIRAIVPRVTAVDALRAGTVLSVTGHEGISEPFAFDVRVSVANELNPAEALRQKLPIVLVGTRYVYGMIDSVELVGTDGTRPIYVYRLVPELSLAEHEVRTRAFLQMKVSDLASRILADVGLTGNISDTGVMMRQLTQFEESDLNFLSRLLEDVGYGYFFEHTSTMDRVTIRNGAQVSTWPTLGEVPYDPSGARTITSFHAGAAIESGSFEVRDWNYQSAAVASGHATAASFADLAVVQFDVLGSAGSPLPDLANLRAGALMRDAATDANPCGGTATAALVPGYRFTLTGHFSAALNREYLVTAVDHEKDATTYHNTFTCVPTSVGYAPPRRAERPSIDGVLMAKVTNNRDPDNLGRVRVALVTVPDVELSWARVAQRTNGNPPTPPQVDDKVLVAFEDGDPERPMVVGTVSTETAAPAVAVVHDRPEVELGTTATPAATVAISRREGGFLLVSATYRVRSTQPDPKGAQLTFRLDDPALASSTFVTEELKVRDADGAPHSAAGLTEDGSVEWVFPVPGLVEHPIPVGGGNVTLEASAPVAGTFLTVRELSVTFIPSAW